MITSHFGLQNFADSPTTVVVAATNPMADSD